MRNFLIMIIMGLTGCQLVVDVDVPIEKRKITVYSHFTPDSLWKAHITLSRHILDDFPFRSPDDAQVFILHNGNPIDTLIDQGNGNYRSESSKPITGTEYEVSVASEKYGTVASRSLIPAAVSVAEVHFDVPPPLTGKEMSTINLRLQDPPEANYYEVVLMSEIKYYNQYQDDTVYYRYPLQIHSNDPMFADTRERSDNAIIFSDVLFNGKEKSFEFLTNQVYGSGNKLLLRFKTLSADLYQYKVTSELQRQISDDPFAQPVKVYNNIHNGFGIFGGYSEVVYTYEQ